MLHCTQAILESLIFYLIILNNPNNTCSWLIWRKNFNSAPLRSVRSAYLQTGITTQFLPFVPPPHTSSPAKFPNSQWNDPCDREGPEFWSASQTEKLNSNKCFNCFVALVLNSFTKSSQSLQAHCSGMLFPLPVWEVSLGIHLLPNLHLLFSINPCQLVLERRNAQFS